MVLMSLLFEYYTNQVASNGFLLHTQIAATGDTKRKSFIKDFFSKCDQIRSKLRIWSHLLKKSLMENFIFCTVYNW